MRLLRSLFGPSKEEIWRQLSHEIGGQFVDGGTWKADKVVAKVGEWTVTLDTFVVMAGTTPVVCTRMRAPFVNRDGFRFTVYPSNLLTNIAAFAGMQDVSIGDPAFDDEYVVKANDEAKARALLSSRRLRDLVRAQQSIHLSVKDDEGWFGASFPDGVDELYFQVTGEVKDLERLKLLYELFAETLNRLCAIGSAYESDPGVTL